MNLPTEAGLLNRRTSERRRLKLLKNSDEYKITNPFKFAKHEPSIPDDLFKQLKKIDYLSKSSISMIQIDKSINNQNYCSQILQKMSSALRNQEDRYQTYFGVFSNHPNPQEQIENESSFPNKKYQTQKSSMINTKQQIPMDDEQDHYKHVVEDDRFLESQMCDEGEIHLFQNQSQPELGQLYEQPKIAHPRQVSDFVIDEQYQNYFIN